MSAVTSSLDRIQSANLNADIFVGYEQTLTPFVLSDCFSRFPAWKDYASAELLSSLVDEHALLECASMTEHCIEHPKYYREDHSDGLDVAALSSSSNHSTPDEETSPSRSHCSSTSPDTANRSFPVFGRTSGPGYVRVPRKSSVGTSSTSRHLDPYAPNDEHLAMSSRPVGYSCGPGSAVDVMDDPVLKRQALLSLRVTALQQLRGAGTDDTASQSNADMEDPPFGMGDSFRLLSPVSAASSPKRHRWMTIRRLTSILQARQSKRCQNSADMESSTGSGPPMELSNTSSPMDLFQALLSNSDNLCVKALLAGSLAVGTVLSLTELTFSHLTPVASPFHVCPSTYCAWAVLCEKGAGTPSHSSINGAHTWSILLRGTKRWLVSHPLDKHLITDSTSGKVAHLQSMNNERFPNAQYARIYSFTQQAGEAVFLPSDAVFFEESLEDTVSVLVNYMDETSELMYARNAREDSILLHQCEGEATAQRAELRPFTLVDIVISAPRSDQHQEDVCILRTLAEFERCSLPRCDLAARVELAGFHRSLGPVGRRMLQNSGNHAVGIPQGFFHTAKDHHLLLSYTSTHKDLQQLRDAISSLPTQPYLSLLNPTHNPRCERYFHHIPTASSMFGCIPKYPPLSVLLNQKWPFEKELCRNLVTIPRIILSKLHSPMGFLRPGSVWHYSRFDSLKGTSSGSLQRQLSCFGADLEAALPSSLDADDWCRTFLFYCNPLFEEPVALHPRVVGATFQEGKEVLQTTTNPDARLRIVEFEWNPNCLEKFGSLKLLQILGRGFPCLPEELADESDEESLGSTELDSEASDTLSNHVGLHLGGGNSSSVNDFIKRVVMHDSHLPRFQEWMVAHHLNPDKCGDPEMYMTPVLWSLCRARVVGYASPMQHESNCTSAEHDAEHPGGCSPSLLSESFGRSTSEYFERCYETVCLAGSAASALLIHKHDSPYASMATSLCNWLCDRTLEGDYAGADLLALMESVVLHGSSEEQAILSEVLKIKRRQSMDVNQSKLHELEMICDVLV